MLDFSLHKIIDNAELCFGNTLRVQLHSSNSLATKTGPFRNKTAALKGWQYQHIASANGLTESGKNWQLQARWMKKANYIESTHFRFCLLRSHIPKIKLQRKKKTTVYYSSKCFQLIFKYFISWVFLLLRILLGHNAQLLNAWLCGDFSAPLVSARWAVLLTKTKSGPLQSSPSTHLSEC